MILLLGDEVDDAVDFVSDYCYTLTDNLKLIMKL